ncbi:MAG: class I SAM-dependent methyltransferase [Hyphomicrobiales bacterium]|nr:class I SAM-dependent methyltransferase [Hyphomicrobiales bacterium]
MVPQIFMRSVAEFIELDSATIVDFGCGQGTKTLGIAMATKATSVIGVDIHCGFKNLLTTMNNIRPIDAFPDNLSFRQIASGERLSDSLKADVVFSWSVFEHLPREIIGSVLVDHYRVLRPGGLGFMQVNPLYYSAFGSHLRTVIDEPWAHLAMPLDRLREEVLHGSKVTSHRGLDNILLGSDPRSAEWRESVWTTYCGLNRVTFRELRNEIERAGFDILDQVTSKVDLEPPKHLLEVYRPEVLLQDGLRMVYRRGRGA